MVDVMEVFTSWVAEQPVSNDTVKEARKQILG
jgi:hypothetical protein